uniref:Caspase family p20 domain-containing protein n=1 Tax=Maylandia zebra TaxID=106582 RepID=A0A3P9DHU9_9CICH
MLATLSKAQSFHPTTKHKPRFGAKVQTARTRSREATLLSTSKNPNIKASSWGKQMYPPWLSPGPPTLASFCLVSQIYPVTQQSQSNRIALLINIETFNTSLYKCRAAKDEKVMQSLLQTLGYEVVRCGDITAKMIDKPLKEFSEHPKLALTDSVFVTLVCYGGTGTEEFEIDQIFQHLNSKNCPALKDKPKIVIIHACRGGDSHLSSHTQQTA